MSVETILNALKRIFIDKDEQIVIWYDENGIFKEKFDLLEFEDIEKIEFNNNAFWIKYHIFYKAPKKKYLIYIKDAKPANKDNWLLDIVLSYYEFKADESSMIIVKIQNGRWILEDY